MLVEARVVGQRGPTVEGRPLPHPVGTVSLRDLIAHVVRHEVAAYDAREQARRVVRVLTPSQVEQGAGVGKVDPAAHEARPAPPVDQAIETALLAVTDGLVFVFADGSQVEDLEEPVDVHDDLRLRFVRLVPLAGG